MRKNFDCMGSCLTGRSEVSQINQAKFYRRTETLNIKNENAMRLTRWNHQKFVRKDDKIVLVKNHLNSLILEYTVHQNMINFSDLPHLLLQSKLNVVQLYVKYLNQYQNPSYLTIYYMRQIVSRNPYSGEIRQKVNFISNEDLAAKLQRSASAFQIHRNRTIQERAQLIKNLADCIKQRFQEIAETITAQMGKPITVSEFQVSKMISLCIHYSQNYGPILPQVVKTEAKKHSLIKYLPLGTIYYLVPFNFPFALNFIGGLPTLLIGNTIIVRNADSCPNIGRIVEELMIKAGFSNGEFQNVYTNYDQIDQIFQHPNVQGVSFTGSTRGGALIAEKAGKYLKKAVMELGGNDPFVVLEDADIKLAVTYAIRGRCFNSGQVCYSPKRFIIDKAHYETFKTQLIEGLQTVKFGDPMQRDTVMGPIGREDLWHNLDNQLKSRPQSYKIVFQRTEMQKPFFPITVIEGSDQTWDQELFGPVYQLFKAENEQHAIKLANSGTYGLGGSVFSASRGEEVLDRIRCGLGFVNDIPKSDINYPSGGVFRSGFGRQSGAQGYRQFANIKTHYVN